MKNVFVLIVLALLAMNFFYTSTVYSAPIPQITLDVPTEILIGESFTFTVTFKNTGNSFGYGPFIDLILDYGGADYANSNCHDDGIMFKSAEMIGVNGGPITLDPTVSIDNPTGTSPCIPCGTRPYPTPHPFLITSTGTPQMIAEFQCQQLVTLQMPFGSFDQTQPEK